MIIKHPLRKGHDLAHSFVEGPLADNIYRGRASLKRAAVVSIDEACNMTPGTFAALNRNPQVFLQNETGWAPVRGAIQGGYLAIERRPDTEAGDIISWMVIAERQDQHMIEADWTDEYGRVITEPESEE